MITVWRPLRVLLRLTLSAGLVVGLPCEASTAELPAPWSHADVGDLAMAGSDGGELRGQDRRGDRWSVELDLRSIKVGMGMAVLRCKTPEMVVKEVWAHMLASNVVRTEMVRAAQRAASEPRRLSLQGAWQAIRAFDMVMRESRGSRDGEIQDARRATIASHRVGDCPGRCEPRAVKRRPKKHRLLTTTRNAARKALLEAKQRLPEVPFVSNTVS